MSAKRILAWAIVSVPVVAVVAGIVIVNVCDFGNADFGNAGLGIDVALAFVVVLAAFFWAVSELTEGDG